MLTQERLKQVLFYDPIVGVFVRRIRTSRNMKIGDFAGGIVSQSNYVFIGIDGKQYQAHKLAFLYMKNIWPNEVDHINRNRKNNSWKNLRIVTRTQNNGNMGISSLNSSGFKGVSYNKRKDKWRAYIKKQGKQHHLGYFENKESAAKAYDVAAINFFGKEYANTNFKEGS